MLMPVTPIRSGVHLRARRQVVQRHQVIAQHHAPERAAHPKIELAGGHLARASLLGRAARPAPVPLAEAVGINPQHDEAALRQCWPRRLRRVFRLEQSPLCRCRIRRHASGNRGSPAPFRRRPSAGASIPARWPPRRCRTGTSPLRSRPGPPGTASRPGRFGPRRQFAQQFPSCCRTSCRCFSQPERDDAAPESRRYRRLFKPGFGILGHSVSTKHADKDCSQGSPQEGSRCVHRTMIAFSSRIFGPFSQKSNPPHSAHSGRTRGFDKGFPWCKVKSL